MPRDKLKTKTLKIRKSEYTVDKSASHKREHEFITLLPKARRYYSSREAGVGWPTPAFPQLPKLVYICAGRWTDFTEAKKLKAGPCQLGQGVIIICRKKYGFAENLIYNKN